MREVVIEAVVVGLVAAALAFAANAISPRGLKLAKNYFPSVTGTNAPVSRPILTVPGASPLAATNPGAGSAHGQLEPAGFQSVQRAEVERLHADHRFDQGLIVFLDARNEDDFRAGHIPGAYEFDAYRTENYIGTLFPVVQVAEQIVLYCNGGDCEDSRFAAIALQNAGIADQKLFIYSGGFTDWATNGLPVELGERNSGQFREAKP